jgi:hypothetical protein
MYSMDQDVLSGSGCTRWSGALSASDVLSASGGEASQQQLPNSKDYYLNTEINALM